MATPFIGEIRPFAFGFAPKGWAVCAGQTLAITQNTALFSILGTTYGGNGLSTFRLPDLQGRSPFATGGEIALGQVGGEESHTLTPAETPQHGVGVGEARTTPNPVGATPSRAGRYNDSPDSQTGAIGGGQSHPNRSPFLAMQYCIAIVGVYPSQS